MAVSHRDVSVPSNLLAAAREEGPRIGVPACPRPSRPGCLERMRPARRVVSEKGPTQPQRLVMIVFDLGDGELETSASKLLGGGLDGADIRPSFPLALVHPWYIANARDPSR